VALVIDEAKDADGRVPVHVIVFYSHALGCGASMLRLARDSLVALDAALAPGATSPAEAARAVLPPLPRPPFLPAILGGRGARTYHYWFDRIVTMLVGTALKWIPGAILKAPATFSADAAPQVTYPFRTSMVNSDPIPAKRWAAGIAAARERGVRPQALLYAAASFIQVAMTMNRARRGHGCASVAPAALKKLQEDPGKLEFAMTVNMRNPARTLPGHPIVGPDDVAMAITFGLVEAAPTPATKFWDLAQTFQKQAEGALTPRWLRFGSAFFGKLIEFGTMGTHSAGHRKGGFFMAPLAPINLGPCPPIPPLSHCAARGGHIGQLFAPEFCASIGFAWLTTVGDHPTFSMEYNAEIWSPTEARAILDLLIELFVNPPAEDSLADYARRVGEGAENGSGHPAFAILCQDK
jgi:hypothetical protein